MEIKDLKVGDEVYVNYWSAYYDYWSKKTIKNITPWASHFCLVVCWLSGR